MTERKRAEHDAKIIEAKREKFRKVASLFHDLTDDEILDTVTKSEIMSIDAVNFPLRMTLVANLTKYKKF